jgi:hypothetical protein
MPARDQKAAMSKAALSASGPSRPKPVGQQRDVVEAEALERGAADVGHEHVGAVDQV